MRFELPGLLTAQLTYCTMIGYYLVVLCWLCVHAASAQTTVFLYEWEGTDPRAATVGINASSVENKVVTKLRLDGNTQGIAAPTNGNGNKDLNMIFADNPAFDVAGIDLSFDYQKDDLTENIFSRNNFTMGVGGMNVRYRVTQPGGTCSAPISSGTYPIPSDDVYRNYRFRYDPNSGQAVLSQDGVALWTNAGTETPQRALCWIGDANITVGLDLDGNVTGNALLDNLHFQALELIPGMSVELAYFTAAPAARAVVLEWGTASESDNDYFELQRSPDGNRWTVIDRLRGRGTTQRTTTYRAVDHQPLGGTAYYRLRQVDFDGTETLSSIVTVDGSAAPGPKVTAYPNPMGDYLYVTGTDAPKLFTRSGRAVPTTGRRESDQGYRLDVRHLLPGVYTLRSNGGARTVVKR